MNTDNIRLIRRVEGRRGSVSLYQCPQKLAEVVRVTEEGTDVLELYQHEQYMLAPLLRYLDQVQKEVDASRPAHRRGRQAAKRSAGSDATHKGVR